MKIGIQRAAQARRDAIARMDKGDIAGAAQMLESRRDELRATAKTASQPERLTLEAVALDQRACELRESIDVMESRKFMVSEEAAMSNANYSMINTARQRRRPPPKNT